MSLTSKPNCPAIADAAAGAPTGQLFEGILITPPAFLASWLLGPGTLMLMYCTLFWIPSLGQEAGGTW
ncbi:hypothetical protein DSO57_1019236 [Entomophthora muscae]|uniref:Uncharacterized protein n=1 Tax=Entomophthora muscae TaxID=34485 RepID=A0ACC2TF69_9FUNG|nr:hypothetical protein DSO57_1019236 [Entomophthora muscae]